MGTWLRMAVHVPTTHQCKASAALTEKTLYSTHSLRPWKADKRASETVKAVLGYGFNGLISALLEQKRHLQGDIHCGNIECKQQIFAYLCCLAASATLLFWVRPRVSLFSAMQVNCLCYTLTAPVAYWHAGTTLGRCFSVLLLSCLCSYA